MDKDFLIHKAFRIQSYYRHGCTDPGKQFDWVIWPGPGNHSFDDSYSQKTAQHFSVFGAVVHSLQIHFANDKIRFKKLYL